MNAPPVTDIEVMIAAVEAVRVASPWRHAARLSAIVWIYVGAGSEISWIDGAPSRHDDRDEDFPYLAGDSHPTNDLGRPGPARDMLTQIDHLLPKPRALVSALHTSDLAPSADMPVLRLPYMAIPAHIAGCLIACRSLLACAPLLLDPAPTDRGTTRHRLSSGFCLAASIAAERSVVPLVMEAAAQLLLGATDRDDTERAFDDPKLLVE